MQKQDYYSEDKWAKKGKNLFYREKISLGLISKFLKDNQNFIDIGCGDASLLNIISRKKPRSHFYGVDNSEYQINQAKKKNSSLNLKKFDLETGIPFDDWTFDFAYGAEIIEHVYSPDFFLAETNRILKKGGYALITTPNLCAWFNRLIFPLGIQPFFYESSTKSKAIGAGIFKRFKDETPVGHIRIFNYAAIKDLLEDNGFKIVDIKGTIFDSGLPKWILPIDHIFRAVPQLSAGFVILARKVRNLK